jgi:hypothetical protein
VENLEIRRCRRKVEESSEPARFETEACGTHTLPCD